MASALLLAASALGEARDTIVSSRAAPSSSGTSATQTANTPSQTTSAATAATAQAAQAAITARRAQDSLVQATAAFQAARISQAAAHQLAVTNGHDLNPNANGDVNGLGVGLLDPVGGATASGNASSIQIVDLGTGGKNQLALGSGGSLTLPTGTSGTEQITISGTGSVTTTGGSITAKAGSVTTTTSGTLAATNGGSVSLTAGSDTLSFSTSTVISSSLAGTVTLPAASGGGTISLAANQAATMPAGSSITFTGSGTGTVTLTGAGTLTLHGAGTLALANVSAGGSGGTITTNSGTTSFTNGAVSSLAAGSSINLTGSGAIDFSSTVGTDTLPIILQKTLTQAIPSFTTTGSVLNTTDFNLPQDWVSVGALSQSTGNGQTTVTITQTQQQALLDWNTFNIGKNTTLDFDQSAGGANVGTWVAINEISNSMAPSQILGQIEAPGQVYVINQNGIIFGASSQVNTHALVASTLPINSNLAGSIDPTTHTFVPGLGLLVNPDSQFLFSQETIPVGHNGTPQFTPMAAPTSGQILTRDANGNEVVVSANGTDGDISVEKGAIISSPTTPEHVGGKIALIGTNVTNKGTLQSPDGQIILAAGQQVGFTAHASSDPSLRGLDVAVGAGTGTVTNGVDGYIDAERADVTLAGANIQQLGQIYSTTSVSLNGRIDLLAVNNMTVVDNQPYFSGGTPGTVYLGDNSLTEILPEYSSTDTTVGTALTLPSLVYVEGQIFHMGINSQLVAPNATAVFGIGILNTPIPQTPLETENGANPYPENFVLTATTTATSIYSSTPGQVNLDSGANLDVSGSNNVAASVTENIVSAQLRGPQLEDDPLQRNGALRGQTVQVDILQTGKNADGSTWYGTPLADLSGYVGLVERTVGELTVAGGTVDINTNGSVSTQATSTINVSGGSINYAGAMVQTTNVVTAGGQVIPIAKASPDLVYQGIDNGTTTVSTKWGVSQTTTGSLNAGGYYESGFVQGGSGGTLTIQASGASLNGSLYGNTTTGARQQLAPPSTSHLNLTVQSSNGQGLSAPTVNVVFQDPGTLPTGSTDIYLSPGLMTKDGFGSTFVQTDNGNITVPNETISISAGGSFTLIGANINVYGQIYVPGGTIQLENEEADPNLDPQQIANYDSNRGNFTLYSSGVLSTAGLTFDELSGQVTPGLLPFTVNGGTISIGTNSKGIVGAVTTLDAGSIVDASGGATRSVGGKISAGNGGNIALAGVYKDPTTQLLFGDVTLDGTLSAYGVYQAGTSTQGGTLTLNAPQLQIGGVAQTSPGVSTDIVSDGNPTIVALQSGFFSQGGFSNFNLSGAAGMEIKSDITPVLIEEVVSTDNNQFGISQISSLQLPQFPATPVNLSFASGASPFLIASSTSPQYGRTILDQGVKIDANPTAKVTLKGPLVDIEGEVDAKGGTITVSDLPTSDLGTINPGTAYSPDITVLLGSKAILDASGEEISTTTLVNGIAYNTGEVLDGGTISISGNIVGETGSRILANGSAGGLDVPLTSTAAYTQSSAFARTTPYVHQIIASNGGQISLNGTEVLLFDGTVSALAGNNTATTGSLTVGSGLANIYTQPVDGSGNLLNSGFQELFVQQSGDYLTSLFGPNPTFTLGAALTPTNTSAIPFEGGVTKFAGGGYIAVDQLFSNQGYGFSNLTLNGNVQFQGNVAINANQTLTISPNKANGTIFGDNSPNQQISLNAPSISIGSSTLSLATSPASGSQTTDTNFSPSYVADPNISYVPPPAPALALPTYGPATLTLNATDLIDVGFLSLQGIGTTNFNVTKGDIRGGGLLYGAGVINFTAGQVYTPTGATFTVAAFDSTAGALDGTVNINWNGFTRDLPLSAGGTINIYGSNINQNGVLVAPFGVINLGNTSAGTYVPIAQLIQNQSNSQANYLTYVASPEYNVQSAPITQTLTLGPKSETSVSGVDSNGQVLDVPYGTNANGTVWYDPSGKDITTGTSTGQVAQKAINLNGATIKDAAGSLINLNGGGDVFSYYFNSGLGGTIDVLNSSTNSFAIIPSYQADYAPIDLTTDFPTSGSKRSSPYTNLDLTTSNGTNLASQISSQLGNQIYLAGGNGLAAGFYTILPARYALLPGAYLVTPSTSTTPSKAVTNPDGSVVMGGYHYNSLNPSQQNAPVFTSFEVDSSAVVAAQAEYDIYSANTFLKNGATTNNNPVPRLPIDAGQLVFNATANLVIQGGLNHQVVTGGLGSTVDISSPDDIYIVDQESSKPNLTPADEGGQVLTLAASDLNGFGADSLLIGGTRSANGTVIDPSTNAIYVQNSSDVPLTGNEIILVSNQSLTTADGADIKQSGLVSTNAENLTIGNSTTLGSGDGTFIRVTGDPNATFSRLGVNTADTNPNLQIGSGASINGVAVTLDSTSAASIAPNAQLDQLPGGQALTLQSGEISLQIGGTASVASAKGLVIDNNTLLTLESSVQQFSLLSYSTIDFYGAGNFGNLDSKGQPLLKSLSLNAAGILDYQNSNGKVTINVQNLSINNGVNQPLPSYASAITLPTGNAASTLEINADTIQLGANTFTVAGYSNVDLNANNGILVSGKGGLTSQGGLNLATPLLTTATAANYSFLANDGAITVTQPATPGTAMVSGGLGGTISFKGSSIDISTTVLATSGVINVEATTGDLNVETGGSLNASGEQITFGNVTESTDGGQVNLIADQGRVILGAGDTKNNIYPINVSTPSNQNKAGSVVVSAVGTNGTFSAGANSLLGTAGTGGTGGVFNLKVGSASTLSPITDPLNSGGFQSLTFDVLTGSVSVDGAVGPALTSSQPGLSLFSLTTEQGAITVNNTINASGLTGGTIDLYANQDVTLEGNAYLTVAGAQLDNGGNGGLIDIETRGGGSLGIDIQSGSNLVLGIAHGAGGVLHLRAPQNSTATDLLINPISGAITNASSIVVEGYHIIQALDGSIDNAEGAVTINVNTFGSTSVVSTITNRLFGNSNPYASVLQVDPGEEIVNPNGDLTLGNVNSTNNYWDLSSLRTASGDPGILTIRAAGNLIFNGSLTDGFAYNPQDIVNGFNENVASAPYTWDVQAGPSWSYRLVAGAQFKSNGGIMVSTANFGEVQTLAALGLTTTAPTNGQLIKGSLELGNPFTVVNNSANIVTSGFANKYAQLIRTGTGDITIDTGGSVDLLNQLATIYTAGTIAPALPSGENFDLPTGAFDAATAAGYEKTVYGTLINPADQITKSGNTTLLNEVEYTAQYTDHGGNVTINAQQDIAHLKQDPNNSANYITDTSWQFPTNWLFRRGASASGVFDLVQPNTSPGSKTSTELATTTWWVDFSNFFEGIGALGGGNVTMNAGGNITNVDAVVPTNAYTPYTGPKGTPSQDVAGSLVQLGGGNLTVTAGGTIAGGTYYVENGNGLIEGANIVTDASTDSARISAYDMSQNNEVTLPLTLFLGNGSFTVEATNELTIGSVVNPFWLPQGISNGLQDHSVFSTYSANSAVSLSSLLGKITVQGDETGGVAGAGSLYDAYLSNVSTHPPTKYQAVLTLNQTPWDMLLDFSVNLSSTGHGNNPSIDLFPDFSTFFQISPPIFSAIDFSGDIKYQSDQLLFPSSKGSSKLLAAGAVEGAFIDTTGTSRTATITLLDDDPSLLPSATNPFGLGTMNPTSSGTSGIFGAINQVFADVGQTASYFDQSLATMQTYHDPGLLHANGEATVQIDTISGNIGDFTLISPGMVNISSGLDLQDVSLYIQNNETTDISVVAANRDITLYDSNSAGLSDINATGSAQVAHGDIQISGPGTLEVLAGRNLDLGDSTGNIYLDGTGLGITSIGSSRNPYLPFQGANIIAGAGIGNSSSLGTATSLNFLNFINAFLNPNTSGAESARYLPDLGQAMGLSADSNQDIWNAFENESPEQRDALALNVFYEVLRDAGRDHNNPSSPNVGTYTEAKVAIAALFDDSTRYSGDISMSKRDIQTTNNGDITLLAPGGQLTVGLNQPPPSTSQGVLTVDGGNINIFTQQSINVGQSRIFTLHGGNEIMYSEEGNIDAGNGSKTVQSAPPSRVLVDPQSADVKLDLAGLSTGSGIGVLATVFGAPPGDVDLIAPSGIVDAGDAGIRSSGNINISATQVLNAGNIQSGGASSGVPSVTAPNISATVAASSAGGASQSAVNEAARQQQSNQSQQEEVPSIISVQVIGYGGGDDSASASPTPEIGSKGTYIAARP